MSGRSTDPKIAVLAIVDPESDEKTVPPAIERHQDQPYITINEQRGTQHVGSKEGKGHGKAQEHRCADRAEQQGECEIPFHVSETYSGFAQIGLVRLATRPAKP